MARYTSIASVLALSGSRLVGALTTAAAAYSSGTSALAVVLAAASEHDECKGYVDADGKGFYRWYTVNSGAKCLSKGRVSQLVTFGRWLDAEREAGTSLVSSEYVARTLQSLSKAKDAAARADYLRTCDADELSAAVAESLRPAPTATRATTTTTDASDASDTDVDDASDDAEAPTPVAGITCERIAAELKRAVAAALAHPSADADGARRVVDALNECRLLVLAAYPAIAPKRGAKVTA
jgi:hypothetical protein